MPSYCLKCKKHTENMNSVVSKTSNSTTVLSLVCSVVKNQD